MTQTKFLCVLRTESGGCEQPSPDKMDSMMADFHAWMERYRDNIVDLGAKLGGGKVVQKQQVLDGPYTESKEIIGGFMIIAGTDIDEALAVARECPPIAASGSTLEVREMISNG